MIYKAISVLENKLDNFLRNRFMLNESFVALSNISEDGSLSETETQNKVLITMINIEREYSMGVNFKSTPLTNSVSTFERPPIHINFHVLFSANFIDKNYDEALKYLSSVLDFIQKNDLLDKYNAPDLKPEIEKLQLEIVNLSFQELSNLWSIVGGKYIPSILCKIRMLTIDNPEFDRIQIANESIQLNI